VRGRPPPAEQAVAYDGPTAHRTHLPPPRRAGEARLVPARGCAGTSREPGAKGHRTQAARQAAAELRAAYRTAAATPMRVLREAGRALPPAQRLRLGAAINAALPAAGSWDGRGGDGPSGTAPAGPGRGRAGRHPGPGRAGRPRSRNPPPRGHHDPRTRHRRQHRRRPRLAHPPPHRPPQAKWDASGRVASSHAAEPSRCASNACAATGPVMRANGGSCRCGWSVVVSGPSGSSGRRLV
jgi:hypothetical protein